MKKFNINDNMYIQITEEGWKHLRNTVTEGYIEHCIKSREVTINGETWYKLQCWDAFETLPSNFGGQPCFKTDVMFDDDAFSDNERGGIMNKNRK